MLLVRWESVRVVREFAPRGRGAAPFGHVRLHLVGAKYVWVAQSSYHAEQFHGFLHPAALHSFARQDLRRRMELTTAPGPRNESCVKLA